MSKEQEKPKKIASNATRRRQKAMIKTLEKNGCNIARACKIVGIDRQTHYNWVSKFDAYKKEFYEVEQEIIDFVESKLVKKINDNDITAMIFFLKTKGKGRGYSERVQHEVKEVDEFEGVQIYLPDNGRNKDK